MTHFPRNASRRALSILSKLGISKNPSDPFIAVAQQDVALGGEFMFIGLQVPGKRGLLACFRGGHELDWIIAKHLADYSSTLYDIVLVAAEDLQVRERLALMAAGLSYIVVDREIYIPGLGINTAARRPNALPEDCSLSYSTQAVLTHALNNGKSRYEISALLAELAIPLKQIGRVADELILAGVGAVDRIGIRAHVEMDECSVTWAAVEPMLSSPIIDSLRIRPRDISRLGKMRIAGEDALPWRTLGSYEQPRRLAMHRRLVKSLKRSLARSDAKVFSEVEIWNRCPARLSPHIMQIDPISLYLSRRSHATIAELGRLRNAISDIW